jgi:predicted lactoylglutathione lyase
MSTRIFVNLPVKDLVRSSEFFTTLGFSFDQRFTDENAGCLVLGDDTCVMLVTEPFFRAITGKNPADTAMAAEAALALEVGSRRRVDELAGLALEAGGSRASEPAEHEGMYERSFADPDGHLWQVFHAGDRVPAG